MPRLAPSIILLVLANLLPMVGVLWWGWSVFSVMFLYWLENIIVGLLNIPRILFASAGGDNGAQSILKRLGTAAFFSVHYGLFTFVHGAFVFSMFAEGQYEEPTPALVWQLVNEQHLYWAVLALFISHLASLILNYLLAGEYTQVTVREMMRKPYGRIVVLQLGIIFGGFLLDTMSAPLAGLIVLLLIKTVFDVRSHIREHRLPEPEAPLVA